MKTIAMIAVAAAMLCGCAHNVAPANAPNQNTADKMEDSKKEAATTTTNITCTTSKNADGENTVQCSEVRSDGFDRMGRAFATGSRYIWDSGLHMYRVMSSEEAKRMYGEAWDSSKIAAQKLYDSLKSAYDQYQKDTTDPNNKKTDDIK